MDNFLKHFLEKGVIFSLEKLPRNIDDSTESDVTLYIRKIIFKNDVLPDFKSMLKSACTSEQFSVKNLVVKKIIKRLHVTFLSDLPDKTKSDIYHSVFLSFASACKDDNVSVFQFFIVLCHILGVSVSSLTKAMSPNEGNVILNEKYFQSVFDVNHNKPTSVSFQIISRLLVCLSKQNFTLHSPEMEPYYKWLLNLIKDIASFQPFHKVFMEIFSTCAELDVRLLEVNFDHILTRILAQDEFSNKDFVVTYNQFIKNTFKVCAKFQRIVKIIAKFLLSIKTSSIHSTPEKILSPDVSFEFSCIVTVASSQQTLQLLEVIIKDIHECCHNFIETKSAKETILFVVASELLLSFLKEVKIFAPSISTNTVQTFVDKLTYLKKILKTFAEFLFNNKSFITENEVIFKNFLALCFYCDEIQSLVNCYLDRVNNAIPSSNMVLLNNEDIWDYCLDSMQWKILLKFVRKSKLENCNLICFQLALQRLRISKLVKCSSWIEDSTRKLLLCQFSSDVKAFEIFSEISPEDIIALIDVLNLEDSKLVTNNLFQQFLENGDKPEVTSWLSKSCLVENSTFIKNIFSEILKETGSLFRELIPEKNFFSMEWLLLEYYDNYNNIDVEKMVGLPEKINYLLKNRYKICKTLKKMEPQEFSKIFKLFKFLPLIHIGDELTKLGLSFVVGVSTIFADEINGFLLLESMNYFLNSDVDASVCFNIGLCINWLNELTFEDKKICNMRQRIIEELVRNSPNYKYGLNQIADAVEANQSESLKNTTALRMLETQVTLYQELGKCWLRAKKRKSDNDLIGDYRNKLAKVISEEIKGYDEEGIKLENYKILFKIAGIELNKNVKANDKKQISDFIKHKFDSYFEFAINILEKGFDESSSLFLSIILQSMPSIRKLIPEDIVLKIWSAVKTYERFNWRLFSTFGNDDQFRLILSHLLEATKEYLVCETIVDASNCFEVWISLFEPNSDLKRSEIQLKLQQLFHYFYDSDSFLDRLPTVKKIRITRFFSFCIKHSKVILTSQMLDIIFHVMLHFGDENYLSTEDYQSILAAQIEAGSCILSRQYAWNKNKVHLSYTLFKHVLHCFVKRCDGEFQPSNDDVIVMSTCAFSLEKWVSLMASKQKDFARISAYFIVSLVSAVVSVTLPPAIKIHLVNCMNHFLSISDSHTVSYLMRTLKPGYQQVFSTIYDQFKKYHKYSGKV